MNEGLPDPFTSNLGGLPLQQPPYQPPSNMNRQQPPPFNLQQSRQGSSTMNELDTLRVHSIELETELRLTKGQLLQAQNGTQYLVNCFANQQSRDVVRGVGQNQFTLENRNQQLETEVHWLRGQLLLESRGKKVGVDSESPDLGAKSSRCGRMKERQLEEEVRDLKLQRESLLNDVLRLLKEDANEYSFRFDDEDPAIYKPLDAFKDKVAALEKEETSLLDWDLLGQSQILGSAFEDMAAVRNDSPVQSPDHSVKKPAIFIRPGDFALLDLDPAEQAKYERHAAREAEKADAPQPHSRAPLQDQTEAFQGSSFAHQFPRFPRPPPTPPHERHIRRRLGGYQERFGPGEHNYLMSNATFIEEKEGEEYLEFWEGLETNWRRSESGHSKVAWKSYYESTVRPMYLQKMAQRHGPMGPVAKGAVPPMHETDAPVTKAEEVVKEAVPAQQELARKVADDPVNIAAANQDIEEGGKSSEAPRAGSPGLEASQWAVSKQEETVASNDFFSKPVSSAMEQQSHEASLSPKCQPPDHRQEAVMPSIPAFGSFDFPPKPASSALNAPIPGLAGGWPQPVPHHPRNRAKSARRTSAPTSEKDPGTWNHLFFGIERKTEKFFVLGKNDRLFRNIIISGIAVGTTLAQVLDRVRGGKIVGAKFLDTAGMKTKPPITTNTVIVEFLESQRAKAFVEQCEKFPLSINKEGEQAAASVQLIRTQTLLLPQALLADLVTAAGALTRVLFLIFTDAEKAPAPDALAREITAFAVRCNYCDLPKHPLRITAAEDGMLLFEYADVRQAAAAWNILAALEWKFGEVSKGFAADPCGRAFEEVAGAERKDGVVGAEDEGGKLEDAVVDELEAEAEAKLREG